MDGRASPSSDELIALQAARGPPIDPPGEDTAKGDLPCLSRADHARSIERQSSGKLSAASWWLPSSPSSPPCEG